MQVKSLGLCAIALLLVPGVTSSQNIQINRDNKTIAISETDEASAPADIAAVSVGFEIYGRDAESTYAEGSKLSENIMSALHKAGVTDQNIESSDQGLQRNTDFYEVG